MTDKTPKRKLTPRQWAEIEALWESGTVTYDDLVQRYGCAMSTFERHFKKYGVVKGSKLEVVKKEVEEKLKAGAIDEATVLAARIRETKEQHYTMAQNLAKLAWNEILEVKRNGQPLAVATHNLKALEVASNVLKKAREERWAVLGLDRPDATDPDELPELQISELTAEQIQELRDRDHSELDDLNPAPAAGDADPGEDEDLEDDPDGVVEEG